jgi:hypothetical protein
MPLQLFAACHEGVAGVGGGQHMGVVLHARQHGLLVLDVHVKRVDEDDRAALARVVAALEYGVAAQIVGTDAEPGQYGTVEVGWGMVERQF